MNILQKQVSIRDNKKIYSLEFQNDRGYKFKFINFGCYIQNIIIPYPDQITKSEDVILGYRNFNDIIKDKSSFNSTVGRVAGRISNSSFFLNNKKYCLYNNESRHHLHGGKVGFNKKIWNIVNLENNNDLATCTMSYKSVDLEEGYPGNLECYTIYTLDSENKITIEFKVITDKDTLVNLTNHNYWNFNGHDKYHKNIANHILSIGANKYCELDSELIPTGKLIDIFETKFDFNKSKEIGLNILEKGGVDNFYIHNNYNKKIKRVLEVFSPLTRMGMTLLSNQPGLQFYTGNNMNDNYIGKNNLQYGKHFGLCFEPQMYPNAINIKKFPSIILKKGDNYNSKIIFCLRNNFK